jgi:hypothetical protein
MADYTELPSLELPGTSSAISALRTCITTHREFCTQSRSHLLQPEAKKSPCLPYTGNVTVLNVNTLRIEEISFNVAFLALSYVLGPSPDTIPWWYTDSDGTAWVRSDELPPTIADAIALCRDLKQRYLWVDQICIDQKDPAALTSAMHNMDRVYASALATIIVACNDCAKERIACCVETSRNVDSGPWQEELQQSRWAERAWTYQEMQLSRRLLVITHSCLHYHCAKENTHRSSFPIWSLSSIQDVSCWFAYSTIVAEYTSRKLSHKIDTLNAIAGMTKSLARFADDTFLAGIPSELIHCGLLWQPTGPCVRQPQWPSWSWAGWTGYEQSMCPVIYPSDGHIESYDADRNKGPMHYGGSRFSGSLGGVRFNASDSKFQMDLDRERLNHGARSRYRQTCNSNCTFPCSLLAHLAADKPPQGNGILTITADIVKIRIEPTYQQSPKFPQLYKCHLMTGETWVGCMFLPRDHLPAGTVVDAEFVVLTELRSYTREYKREVFGGMLGAGPDGAAFEESFLESAEHETKRQFAGWTKGTFNSKTGWSDSMHGGIDLNRHALHSLHGPMGDPHHGMPFPATVALRHVLWIARDKEQDLAFRKGLGIVTDFHRGHKETFLLA